MQTKPKVLLVPDLLYWVTAKIGFAISREWGGLYDFDIISEPVLMSSSSNLASMLARYSVVHALTPHIATRLRSFISQPVKLIATVHHVEDDRSIEPVPYADAIMTVSPQWDRYLRHRYPNQSDRTFIARNGIETKVFKPVDLLAKDALRRSYGIPRASFVVGFSCKRTSNSCDRKGIDVLESLIRSPELTKAGVHWLIRGPGWNELVTSTGAANVTYLPYEIGDINLARSYQVMDAYVITSRIEGGPVPLLEAMSCGVTTVSTPVGIAREAIKNSKNGFLVPFGGDQQIKEIILSIADDYASRMKFGVAARETILASYTWKSTLVNIGSLYSCALERESQGDQQIHSLPELTGKGINDRKLVPYKVSEDLTFADFLQGQGAIGAATHCYFEALRSSVADGPKQFLRTLRIVSNALFMMSKGKFRGTRIFQATRSIYWLICGRA